MACLYPYCVSRLGAHFFRPLRSRVRSDVVHEPQYRYCVLSTPFMIETGMLSVQDRQQTRFKKYVPYNIKI